MTHRFHLALCTSVFLAVAACTPSVSEWTPTEAPKKPRVDFVRMQHVATFTPGSAELARGEKEKLDAFLAAAEIGADDRIYFTPASEDKLTAARIGKLAHQLSQRGVGATTMPPGPVPVNHMVIAVERYVVTPPECPNWTGPAVGDHSNQPPSNFGCAVNTNFALMVADPRDLVIGRTLGPAEGDSALLAVQRYRADKLKPLPGGGSQAGAGASAAGAGASAGGGGQ